MSEIDSKNTDPLLIAALASGATIARAAKLAGISERTVYRRLEDDSFRQAVTRVRADLIREATGTLASSAQLAADTLVGLLGDDFSSIRLGAARTLLDTLLKYHEMGDLADQIASLRSQLNCPGEKADEDHDHGND